MIVAHGKKDGALYVAQGKNNSIAVAQVDLDQLWHSRLGHMREKGGCGSFIHKASCQD